VFWAQSAIGLLCDAFVWRAEVPLRRPSTRTLTAHHTSQNTTQKNTTGVRKEIEVDGRDVLIFWYRNQIYAIEARSPAEGAYSEGFIKAKFTQVRAVFSAHAWAAAAARRRRGEANAESTHGL
jgi:hypothetical protein